MSECNIDVKIGTTGTEQKQHYSTIDISLQLSQDKLPKINSDLCSFLSKTTTPFIVVEYPHAQPQQCLFKFDSKDFEGGEVIHHGRVIQYANPKNKQTIKLIKNLEKEFQKITKLKNHCALKVSLYREGQESKGLEVLDRAKVKGHVTTDAALMGSLMEIIRRISNEFLNSPIMAILQLFQQLNFKVELESPASFPEDLKQWLTQLLDFSTYLNKDVSAKANPLKGEMLIHITLPKLFSLKVKAQISTLSSFLGAFC